MQLFVRNSLATLFVLFLVLTPLARAHASVPPFFSFGGRIVSMNFCLGGFINFMILPAGIQPISYVWTPPPATISVPAPIPVPTHPGQEVLGIADPALIPCIGFGTHPPIWFGFHVLYFGGSAI